ncbi:hypothetical protein [Brucella vulpis]|uniref:hypothetical protein n=1 Tax=Brucella vulpis TaxID=981386 RepID=UPI00073ACDD7|nr:hypothetical protein BF3285c2_0613 [Brucella vulpis]
MKNPSIFGSSQKRGVLIPICSRFESVTFRESEAILTLPEVCQQSERRIMRRFFISNTDLLRFRPMTARCCATSSQRAFTRGPTFRHHEFFHAR